MLSQSRMTKIFHVCFFLAGFLPSMVTAMPIDDTDEIPY